MSFNVEFVVNELTNPRIPKCLVPSFFDFNSESLLSHFYPSIPLLFSFGTHGAYHDGNKSFLLIPALK